MRLAISNDRRSALALVGLLLLCGLVASLGCSHAQPTPARFAPPVEAWPACAGSCVAQGGVFLGVLLPTQRGPAICACARPQAAAPWGGGT